jgi:PAS domain S-box-containing protein
VRRRAARLICVVLVILAAFLRSQASSAGAAREVRRVLIINVFDPLSSPGVAELDQGIIASLDKSPYQIELYSESLEMTLFPDEAHQQQFREWYTRKYHDRKPDVIIAVGLEPIQFLALSHKVSFPDTPIVFCGSTEEMLGQLKLDSDFTGVWEAVQPDKTLIAALYLQPRTKHVVVVGGVGAYDRYLQAIAKESFRKYESRFDFQYLTDLDMPALLERLKHLPDDTIVYHTSLMQDASGTRFIDATQAVPLIASASKAPVFVVDDVDLGRGTAGGDLLNFTSDGRVVGEMAVRVLNGEKPRDIPIVKSATVYMFDWRALQRWGLRESDLPADSTVLNREPTVWESYKGYIIGGIALILAEALLIFALVWQRARAIKAETERRRAEEAIRESEKRFRLVANTAPVMIWTAGTDRKCSYVNKTWLDFTGRALEEELGDSWAGGLHPDDVRSSSRTYTEAFDRRESFELHYRLRRHDGEYRWVLDKGVPRFNPDGSFAGYIGSCIDITERKLAEEGLATIGRRLIEAQEQERTWIGRELHDDINQRLALLAFELDGGNQDSSEPLSELVRRTQERIIQISEDVQGLSHRLHSSKLEYFGLASAASSFCKELSEQNKVEIQFNHSELPRSLSKEVSLCLFRVLQEALQNAVKHSGVRSFTVDLHGTADAIDLEVADGGRGFEEREAFTRHGLGLISMRERMQLVHGELSVKSKPGAGTTIRARAPLRVAEYRAMVG